MVLKLDRKVIQRAKNPEGEDSTKEVGNYRVSPTESTGRRN